MTISVCHSCMSQLHIHMMGILEQLWLCTEVVASADLQVAVEHHNMVLAGLVAAAHYMVVEGTQMLAGLVVAVENHTIVESTQVVAGLEVAVEKHTIVEGTQVVAGVAVPESGNVVDADMEEVVHLAESHACLKK